MNPPTLPPLTTPADRDFFFKNGWLVVPGVWQPEAIARARAIFDEAFRTELWRRSPQHDSPGIINDIYRHFPELVGLVFNERYFQVMRELVGGEVVWLPECAVHHNRYASWHKDTTEQEIGGVASHRSDPAAAVMLQVAAYFQPNTPEEGGGITVVPGSHLKNDRFVKLYDTSLRHRLWRKVLKLAGASSFQRIERRGEALDVPHHLGDLVIFDVRAEHRATSPKGKASQDKYAIFNTFGNPTPALREYLEFMKRRPEPYYRLLSTYRVPDSLLRIAERHGIQIWQ